MIEYTIKDSSIWQNAKKEGLEEGEARGLMLAIQQMHSEFNATPEKIAQLLNKPLNFIQEMLAPKEQDSTPVTNGTAANIDE